jgi:apolipoprotein N-acyltransferase
MRRMQATPAPASTNSKTLAPLVARFWQVPAAAFAAVLVVASFPRYGACVGIEHIVWIALVPLILATRGVGGARGWTLGWVAGMTLECAGFCWILYAIRRFTGLGAVAGSLIFLIWLLWATLPWALFGFLLGRARDAASALWLIPAWVGIEHFTPRLFHWHLGGALYDSPWFAAGVDVAGTSGLTALVLCVNIAISRAVEWRCGRSSPPVVISAIALLGLTLTLGYGAWRVPQLERIEAEAPRLRIGFIQGAFDPNAGPKDDPRTDELSWYLDETEKLVGEDPSLDLIVWPEGVLPGRFSFIVDSPGVDAWALFEARRRGPIEPGDDRIRARFAAIQVPLVIGGSALRVEGREVRDAYNVAVYLEAGKERAIYRKNHRIPFGENVDWIPQWVKDRFGLRNIGALSPGRENPLVELDGHPFRHLVCYEVVLPSYVRESSVGASFLVNVTEDIWYGDTAHVSQHLSVLRLRSMESRIPIVRCTNVGPSGICRVTGDFASTGPRFAPAIFIEELAPVAIETLYDRGGYLFPLVAALIGAFGAGRVLLRRHRHPPNSPFRIPSLPNP